MGISTVGELHLKAALARLLRVDGHHDVWAAGGEDLLELAGAHLEAAALLGRLDNDVPEGPHPCPAQTVVAPPAPPVERAALGVGCAPRWEREKHASRQKTTLRRRHASDDANKRDWYPNASAKTQTKTDQQRTKQTSFQSQG